VACPSLNHTMRGFSPFLIFDLSEDQVATLTNEADLLPDASLVSVNDLRNYRQKMKIGVPDTADKFLLLLKRYANLLFASRCPMFKCVKEIIREIQAYSREAQESCLFISVDPFCGSSCCKLDSLDCARSTFCTTFCQCIVTFALKRHPFTLVRCHLSSLRI